MLTTLVFYVIFFVFALLTWAYGLYLAFSASIILGFIALLVEPAPFALGVVALFGHPELAQKIADLLGI